jgi:hypothetical protein
VIFWYTQSPDDMLDSLLEMEATAVELRTPCTHDDVKSMFSTPVLPKTPGFATGKPSAIAKVFFLWIRCFFFFLGVFFDVDGSLGTGFSVDEPAYIVALSTPFPRTSSLWGSVLRRANDS